jgi:hypothetical protein
VQRFVTWTLGLAALLLVIQLVPYGRDHTNPSGGHAIRWDSARTERLATGACMDCHSNLTRWPWYSNVAPVSWLVQRDVDDGRRALNLSLGTGETNQLAEVVREGRMPPWQYKPTHPDARLTAVERRELIHGLEATFGAPR